MKLLRTPVYQQLQEPLHQSVSPKKSCVIRSGIVTIQEAKDEVCSMRLLQTTGYTNTRKMGMETTSKGNRSG
ncbi:TPA: hypothetical protein ACIECA_002729 [Enterococcus faecium]|uniref:hypothetical protein n=1 Tax=Enterococcus faecium TaxID=1352 RepID=UPI00372927E2